MTTSEALRTTVVLFLLAAFAGCSDGSDPLPALTHGAPARGCHDLDGDGFGALCEAGGDCDDTDPTVWDECEDLDPDASAGGGGGGDHHCAEGSTRECKIMLPPQGSVTSCFVGVETCTAGTWGPCE